MQSKPVDIKTELSIKQPGQLLSQSPNRITHIHIVILLLLFLVSPLRFLFDRSRKLTVQPHILIQSRNPDITSSPDTNIKALEISRVRVTVTVKEDFGGGDFW